MKGLAGGRYALSSCVAAALLAACVGSQQPIGTPGAMYRALSSSYHVLYRFHRARHHGIFPSGPLTDVSGTLYGATLAGGIGCPAFAKGCGTVYGISATGTEKIVYSISFDESPAVGALLNVAGTLYGTTYGYVNSGTHEYGAVYTVTTTGKYTLLYTFRGRSDGVFPTGSLIDVGGVLYGTTRQGGGQKGCVSRHVPGCGTVYSITTGGNEKVLYRFSKRDGMYPNPGLVDIRGTLYGTTEFGGSGFGTVFSLTMAGKENVLHSFQGGSDGTNPSGGLVNVNGTLYGTTLTGGGSGCFDAQGCGTVFSVTTSGKKALLYSFKGGDSDGEHPRSQLVNVNGMLYGTTSQGGGSSVCSAGYGPYGCGTVYSVSTSGVETMLHSFASDPDGATPSAGLIEMKGTLYGTTTAGGMRCPQALDDPGCGTVFALTP